ncbi:MAG TPA: spore cortex biosynthesis protein YabQ [Clostridiales bacterium]|nr:spore cortex biosynthesis protein YabQ [Clostridia bacterium]HCS72437.1 spore cortex biosynthesis protein YabQ [Clostridiales bacterium]
MSSTSNQAYIFLSTVYAGLIIGFLYDCCRMIRKMVRVNVIVTGILDLLFWSVIGVLSFLVLFYVNDGNVRFYTLLGFIIGWILYLLALSPLIMKGLNWIYDTLARLIQWLGKIIQWPFRQLWKALAKPYRWLKRETDRIKKYFINVFQKFRGKTEG